MKCKLDFEMLTSYCEYTGLWLHENKFSKCNIDMILWYVMFDTTFLLAILTQLVVHMAFSHVVVGSTPADGI